MNNKTLKLGVLAIIVLWIAGMGWYQYIRVEPLSLNQAMRPPSIKINGRSAPTMTAESSMTAVKP